MGAENKREPKGILVKTRLCKPNITLNFTIEREGAQPQRKTVSVQTEEESEAVEHEVLDDLHKDPTYLSCTLNKQKELDLGFLS